MVWEVIDFEEPNSSSGGSSKCAEECEMAPPTTLAQLTCRRCGRRGFALLQKRRRLRVWKKAGAFQQQLKESV